MAQDRLILAASATVMVAGAAAEVVAPAATALLTASDFAAGASLALAAAALPRVRAVPAALALATAVLWFVATLSGADDAGLAGLGSAVLLLYRGPLLHLLLCLPTGRLGSTHERALVVCAYTGAALPVDVAGPVTGAAALAIAAVAALRARRAPANERRALIGVAGVTVALAVVWLLASAGVGSATALAFAVDALLIAASAFAIATRGGGVRGAVGALVVDLGPGSGEATPVVTRLARVLADPDLELRFRLPGFGWIDEAGHATAAPNGKVVTRAAALDGGEVALLHGAAAIREPALTSAAARAAVLALDTVRLDAETRTQAEAVRSSRARLLTAADAERRALEDRLARGPMLRLDRVEEAIAGLDVPGTGALRRELGATRDDLAKLAAGLYPATVAAGDLAAVLEGIAARSPVPATVELRGDASALAHAHRATVCFVASEALANVAKYARATRASVAVRVGPDATVVEVRDDGVGSAAFVVGRGLSGLRDRVEALGGRMDLSSPRGGPTVVTARLAISRQAPADGESGDACEPDLSVPRAGAAAPPPSARTASRRRAAR